MIGGYLGSGKTTLINRLLAQQDQARLAVLVNDFGALNIDAALIDSASAKTITLTNGCVCCVVGDDLGIALADLSAVADDFDHVLLEASGVADSVKLGSQARTWPGFALSQVVTLVDVGRTRKLVGDKFVGRHVARQLVSADLLLLTKTDLAGASELQAFVSWLEGFSTVAQLDVAKLELARLLNVQSSSCTDGSAALDVSPHPRLQAVTYRSRRPVSRARFEGWLDNLAGKVVRAKGFVRFAESPERYHLLQLVDTDITITPQSDSERVPESALVLFARDVSGIPDPFFSKVGRLL